MEWTGLNELRESYLKFFESKGCLRHKSYPLVPQNDNSLLLIVARYGASEALLHRSGNTS